MSLDLKSTGISPWPWHLVDDTLTITDANGSDICVGCTSPHTTGSDLKNVCWIAVVPEMVHLVLELERINTKLPESLKGLISEILSKAVRECH